MRNVAPIGEKLILTWIFGGETRRKEVVWGTNALI
jgi:hypothetical protein